MTLFEYLIWWFFGIVPRRYGKAWKVGYFYTSYYNDKTNENFVLENRTGRILER